MPRGKDPLGERDVTIIRKWIEQGAKDDTPASAKLPPVGTKIGTGKGPVVVTRTDAYQEAVWVRDEDGAEHRIAYEEMPPGPYHKCGDCNCGAKKKGRDDKPDEPEETPPDAWADPPETPQG